MRCVHGMRVTEETEQGLSRLTLRAYSRVHQVCHVILGLHVLRVDVTLDLGFHVVVGVGRLTVTAGRFYNVNFMSTRTRNSKNKVLFFWMLQSDFVLSSSTQSVAQILAYFTSRKRVFWGVLSTSSEDNSWEELACEFLRSETSVHQNFPEFLQPLRDFRTCTTWVGRKRMSPFYHGLLFCHWKILVGLVNWLVIGFTADNGFLRSIINIETWHRHWRGITFS